MQDKPKVFLKLSEKRTITDLTYAREAELFVDSLKNNNSRYSPFGGLSMSKLRGIYSLITNIYTRVNKAADFEEYKSDLQYIKVKMAYESGREKAVEKFVTSTGLMAALDQIKTYDQFILYCRYAESLVAFFKFYGGKE